ncbi:predicted protein [Plenodomus lingam JN3]|uniref:Predicted protein n=1 Tax=Leptosphaeria maculans (strain JN3 / isolate v23.1.3 / race Av1-4-5-6-7-8) TaxID=985895 RepID=E4ZRP9_LEPMJ|nr:predicted protein [Plenodomus lingam JN3]CBX93896.1 predicted protein [Plenodomus lingam JN3]
MSQVMMIVRIGSLITHTQGHPNTCGPFMMLDADRRKSAHAILGIPKLPPRNSE